MVGWNLRERWYLTSDTVLGVSGRLGLIQCIGWSTNINKMPPMYHVWNVEYPTPNKHDIGHDVKPKTTNGFPGGQKRSNKKHVDLVLSSIQNP